MQSLGALGIVPLVFSVACQRGPAPPGQLPPEGSPGALHHAAAPEAARVDECAERVAAFAEQGAPAPPGVGDRARLLGMAKGSAVVFFRNPTATSVRPEALALRTELAQAKRPREVLSKLVRRLRRDLDLAREVLLTERYLYAETPEVGQALVDGLRLTDLLSAPTVLIERGRDAFLAEKTSRGYVYTSGVETGRPARLLLFDRVHEVRTARADSNGGTMPEPLHGDLEPLAFELGFDRARLVRASRETAHFQLRYGEDWVDSLFERQGASLKLDCEVVDVGARERVRQARELGRRRGRTWSALRHAIDRQASEVLPFDEPKSEEGQQDGNLRPEWIRAYRRGAFEYTFNEDRYQIFDALGRPRVPQVCIDFITDTFERASGSWWRGLGEPRERAAGRLRFGDFDIENTRSVEHFLAFAARHPEWFDVVTLPLDERVPFVRREAFFGHLATHADRYRPGDVVVIYGLRDDEKMHYHSFFVYAADPLTGAPTSVAANAGRVRIRAFAEEMLSAPKRSVHSRIRPRLEWLESVVDFEQNVSAQEPARPRSQAAG